MTTHKEVAVGRTFGTVNVTGLAEPKSGHRYWHTVCICGRRAVVRGSSLLAGKYLCRCQPAAGKPYKSPPMFGTVLTGLLRQVANLETELAAVRASQRPSAQKPATPGIYNISLEVSLLANDRGDAVTRLLQTLEAGGAAGAPSYLCFSPINTDLVRTPRSQRETQHWDADRQSQLD